MSIHAEGRVIPGEVNRRVALRDSGEPAGKMGSTRGTEMLNSDWNSSRMTLASSKSSREPARWGWLAYARDAASALWGLGTDLQGLNYWQPDMTSSGHTRRGLRVASKWELRDRVLSRCLQEVWIRTRGRGPQQREQMLDDVVRGVDGHERRGPRPEGGSPPSRHKPWWLGLEDHWLEVFTVPASLITLRIIYK